jgi:hypothetical protein
MKKTYFLLISAIASVFLLAASCGSTKKSGISSPADNKQSDKQGEGNLEDYLNDNLLEKYNLTMGTGIWNDYMPVIAPDKGPYPERFSICTIHFDSPVEIPPMEVSATIITERITMPVLLYDIYGGNGTNGSLFRKDFRPVNGVRLNDEEEYTIEVTLKIQGEQQTVTTEKQKVFVTH